MGDIIFVKPDKCIGCNACIRACPAPEANIVVALENRKNITRVNSEKCIACGKCLKTCPQGARDYIDDTEACITQMSSEKMLVMADPAIKTVFPTKWKGILNWFRKKGCLIYDVSFGADIYIWVTVRAIEQRKLVNVISQACPAIVNYTEIYNPEMLPYISPIHSPAACAIIYAKNYARRNNPVVYLSPCIAKRKEFDETGLADYNITFRKLEEYFNLNDIRIPTNETDNFSYDFDNEQGHFGTLISRPAGIRDNIWYRDVDVNIASFDGVERVYSKIDSYDKTPEQKRPKILELLSCEGGCNMGAGTAKNLSEFEVCSTMWNIEKELLQSRKSNLKNEKFFRKFDADLNPLDFFRKYKSYQPSAVPLGSELDEVFKSMKKNTKQEKNINCGACGYKTCHEMACAIYRKLNVPENCIQNKQTIEIIKEDDTLSSRYSEFVNDCLVISLNIREQINTVASNLIEVDEIRKQAIEKTQILSGLLTNIINFCRSKETMNKNTVAQLARILESTQDAFNTLKVNIDDACTSSDSISICMQRLNLLTNDIHESLTNISED